MNAYELETFEIIVDGDIANSKTVDFNKDYTKDANAFESFNDVKDYFEKELEEKYDFEITEHKLRFYGYCNQCKQRN